MILKKFFFRILFFVYRRTNLWEYVYHHVAADTWKNICPHIWGGYCYIKNGREILRCKQCDQQIHLKKKLS